MTGVAAGDVTGDGRNELLAQAGLGGRYGFLVQDGRGGWEAEPEIIRVGAHNSGARAAVLADVLPNGRRDVVIAAEIPHRRPRLPAGTSAAVEVRRL